MTKKFTLLHGKGDEFREDIGREILNAILKRDDAEYERLNRILHPDVQLRVCAEVDRPNPDPATTVTPRFD